MSVFFERTRGHVILRFALAWLFQTINDYTNSTEENAKRERGRKRRRIVERTKDATSSRRNIRGNVRNSRSLVALLVEKAVFLIFFSFPLAFPSSLLSSIRSRRHSFAHEPGIRLVCALITLLESPSFLATFEINGGLPIVTASYMGWKALPASRSCQWMFDSSSRTELIISARIDCLWAQKTRGRWSFLQEDSIARIRFIICSGKCSL